MLIDSEHRFLLERDKPNNNSVRAKISPLISRSQIFGSDHAECACRSSRLASAAPIGSLA
jgi:hypothetical protein